MDGSVARLHSARRSGAETPFDPCGACAHAAPSTPTSSGGDEDGTTSTPALVSHTCATMDSSRTAAAAAGAAAAVVITPQVRVLDVATRTAAAADPEENQQDVDLGDATFEEEHRVKEVEERRALNGCVWFRCRACDRMRRLMNWSERMSKRRRLPSRCDEHPEPRRRNAGCAATDEWLKARLGTAFGDLVHKRLAACANPADLGTGSSASMQRSAVLAELGIVASPLTELLLREHLFISIPEDPQVSLRAAPPELYRLAEGCVVWARANQAAWWPGQIVVPVVRLNSRCPYWCAVASLY